MSPPVERWTDGDVSHTRQLWTWRDVRDDVRATLPLWQLMSAVAGLSSVVAVVWVVTS